MRYALAAAPFAVAALTLLALRWPAPRAGAATLIVAILAALASAGGQPVPLAGAMVDGLATVARVLYVLFAGLLLYRVLAAGGAVDAMARFLVRVEPSREPLALLVVVGAAPFFESVTGFGVAIIISAPILLGAGFPALRAAALASWGQCAVPWGALAVGTVVGADLAGVGFQQLSDRSALLNLPLFPVYGLAALAIAGGRSAVRSRGAEAILLGLVAGAATLATSVYLAPELAGAVGGLAAVGAFLVPRRRRLSEGVPWRALAPYAFLVALVAVANGPSAVSSALATLGPALAGPGPWLLAAAALATLTGGIGTGGAAAALRDTTRQWLPVAAATLTFILAGRVLADGGAAELLARGAAGALGPAYALASPLIGALGGALTGSNVGSNALFMAFQVEAGTGTGASVLEIAAVQNVSGSHASLLAPQRLVLAATAVGLAGREAQIAGLAFWPVAVVLLLLSASALV